MNGKRDEMEVVVMVMEGPDGRRSERGDVILKII